MCSNGVRPESAATVVVPPVSATGHAPSIVAELHEVLDRLLGADLSGLSAAEHEQMVLGVLRAQRRLAAGATDAVAAFDTADVASTSRHHTTKRWLELRARESAGAASQLARTARALRDHLPATRDALADGQVSPQHVSAIVGVVGTIGSEHAVAAEPLLLDLARGVDPSAVRAAAAAIHEAVDPAGAEQALHKAYAKRGVSLSVSAGFGYLRGMLDLESTEVLQSALMPLMVRSGEDDQRSVPQLRADALVDLAKRGLDTGLDTQLGGERAHVSVVIDEAALREGAGTGTVPWTGAVWSAATVRRWTCDAQLTPVLARLLPPPGGSASTGDSLDGRDAVDGGTARGRGAGSLIGLSIGGGWLPLDVGRASRTVTTAQTKALRVRDGGCVHPGCSRTAAYCDAHHVEHWADGGATSLGNLVLLCRHHHRTLHAGQWSLTPDSGQPGLFWASAAGWVKRAQTAADRSPPIRVDSPAGRPSDSAQDPARGLWQ